MEPAQAWAISQLPPSPDRTAPSRGPAPEAPPTILPVKGDLHFALLGAQQGLRDLRGRAALSARPVQEIAGAGPLHHLGSRVAAQLAEAVVAVDDRAVLYPSVGDDELSAWESGGRGGMSRQVSRDPCLEGSSPNLHSLVSLGRPPGNSRPQGAPRSRGPQKGGERSCAPTQVPRQPVRRRPPPPPAKPSDWLRGFPRAGCQKPAAPPRLGPGPDWAGVSNVCQQPRRKDKHWAWRGRLKRVRDGGQPSLCPRSFSVFSRHTHTHTHL